MRDPADGTPRCSTGVGGLDTVLLGGLPIGHVYLVEGTPGTGKTTLALQFIQEGLRQNESVLYVALSETKAELQAVARSHGWNPETVPIFAITPLEAAIERSDQYSIFHPDEIEMPETIKLITDEVKRVQATRVVVDSLAELRLLSRDSIRYRRQTLALKQHFTDNNVTVLLLDDHTSQNSDHQLHSLVHGVIALQRLAREYGRNRRRLEVVKLRGAEYAEGYHDYAIRHGGTVVFPRLVTEMKSRPPSTDMVSSDTAGLDSLLGGGIGRGTSTLVVGPAGSGKTTLTLKYAVAAVGRAEPVAIYSFDESLDSLLSRGDSLGMRLTQLLSQKKITVDTINPAEVSPGDFAVRVQRSVEQDKAQVVVIDSLNGYMTAMPQEEGLDKQMHELLSYLNQRGVITILILAQQGVLGSMQTTVDLSYLADNIILLRFFEAAGHVRRAISVVKKREGPHEQTIREFTIGLPDGLQIGQPLQDFEGILSGIPRFIGHTSNLSDKA